MADLLICKSVKTCIAMFSDIGFVFSFFTIVVGRTYSVWTGLPPRVMMMSDVTSEVIVDTSVMVMVV